MERKDGQASYHPNAPSVPKRWTGATAHRDRPRPAQKPKLESNTRPYTLVATEGSPSTKTATASPWTRDYGAAEGVKAEGNKREGAKKIETGNA
jgi:hypothetical protein